MFCDVLTFSSDLKIINSNSMAAVESNMMPLGTVAPDFNLLDVLSQVKTKSWKMSGWNMAWLVMFICAHCPFCKEY